MRKRGWRGLALLVLFSAVLSSGALADQLDNWHPRTTSPQASKLRSVVYGNSTFVAVGHVGEILTSCDGEEWVWETTAYDTTRHLNGVAYGNGTFVAVGVNGVVSTSPNGKSWKNRTYDTADNTAKLSLCKVAYGDSAFVAVGGTIAAGGAILTSFDNGVSWVSGEIYETTGFSRVDLYDIAYGNNTFVAVGLGWEEEFFDVSGVILTSSNGTAWTCKKVDNTTLYAVTYGGGTFVTIGDVPVESNGVVLTSSDGYEWFEKEIDNRRDILGIAYGNNTFVAVGELGTILTSPGWAAKTSGVSDNLCGITYGNNTFVAVGEKGIILQSGQEGFPTISVSPTKFNFGRVNVGNLSSKVITVKNTGQADLVIGAVSIIDTTNSANFKYNTCYARTIAPADSTGIKVTFSPKSEGSKTAKLLISSNAPYNSTVTVQLSGYGNGLPQINSLVAFPSSGKAPLNVKFTIEAYDPDGRIVGYSVDFDGNGRYDSYGTTNSKTVKIETTYCYNKACICYPKVKVVDNKGNAACGSVKVKVK